MLVSDLIKELQKIEADHELYRYHEDDDMLGPAEVVIDAWEDGKKYAGYSPNIKLSLDPSNGNWLIRWVGW